MFFNYPQWLGGVSDPSMTMYPPRAFNPQGPHPTRVRSPDNGFRSGYETSDGDQTIADDGLSQREEDDIKSRSEDTKPSASAAGDNSTNGPSTAYAPPFSSNNPLQPPPPYTHQGYKPHNIPHGDPNNSSRRPFANFQQSSQAPHPRSKSTPPSSAHSHHNSNPQSTPRPTTPHEYHQAQAGKHNQRSYKPPDYNPFYHHPVHCPGHAFAFPNSWPSEAAFNEWHAKQKLVYNLIQETRRAQEKPYTAGGWIYSQEQHAYVRQGPPAPHEPSYEYHGQFQDQANAHKPWRQQTYPGSRYQTNFASDYTHEHDGHGAPPRYQAPPKQTPPPTAPPSPSPKKRTPHRSYVPARSCPSATKPKPITTIKDAFLSYDEQWDILIAPNDNTKLTFFTVPWPQFPRPDSLEAINGQMIRRFLVCSGVPMKISVRKALLRFHPDKIANLIANVEDDYKDYVSKGCVAVTRYLNEMNATL